MENNSTGIKLTDGDTNLNEDEEYGYVMYPGLESSYMYSKIDGEIEQEGLFTNTGHDEQDELMAIQQLDLYKSFPGFEFGDEREFIGGEENY
jgi:hypothetical protein